MKKIIVALIGILCLMFITSCSVTKYTMGNLSLLNDNGELIKQYNDAYFDSVIYSMGYEQTNTRKYALKNNGVNFVDKEGKTNYVSGGIIIIEDLHSNYVKNELPKVLRKKDFKDSIYK